MRKQLKKLVLVGKQVWLPSVAKSSRTVVCYRSQSLANIGGDGGIRTRDPLLAKHKFAVLLRVSP